MKALPITIFFFVLSLVTFSQNTDFYAKHWSQVYAFELKDLPKSALNVVDEIYRQAKRDNDTQQLTKALIYQSKFIMMFEDDAELTVVQNLKKEILAAKPPQKNLLESILATLYWQYFQEKRWTYYNRSVTDLKINADDFRTWDAAAMFVEIDFHFQQSLQDPELLKSTKLSVLKDIIVRAENSTLFRPTLFDLLAHNALAFYRTGESLIHKPVGAFKIGPDFLNGFNQISLPPADSLSPKIRALHLFRTLQEFHANDSDPSAYIDLEIERIQFITNEIDLENKIQLQKEALLKLKNNYNDHPASTLAGFQLANLINAEGNQYNENEGRAYQFRKREAAGQLKKILEQHPKGLAADKCSMLIDNILAPALAIRSESYIPGKTNALLQVSYKNIDSLKLSAIPISESFENSFPPHMNDSTRLANYRTQRTDTTWSIRIKNIADYQHHVTETILPALPVGRYLILATVPGSGVTDLFAYSTLRVTNLAITESNGNKYKRYQIVDRTTGKPKAGAGLHITNENDPDYNGPYDKHFQSDKNGFIFVPKDTITHSQLTLQVTAGNDYAVFGRDYLSAKSHYERAERETVSAKTFLFTDRAIYRPGQTVHFKGILIKTQNKKSTIVADEYLEIVLDDPNGQENHRLRLKTNSYGSVSGEFILPANGLNGEFSLYAEEDSVDTEFYEDIDDWEDGEIPISVEEYKRPTFEATFSPVKELFAVNDSVSVVVNGNSFSGAKIDQAKVVYRVVRNTQLTNWYYRRHNTYGSEELEMTRGEGTTDANGSFVIRFKALADPLYSPRDRPEFIYHITADITDRMGETRSTYTDVRVGYHSQNISINGSGTVNRNSAPALLQVVSENLNDEYVPAKGTVEIFKLTSPLHPIRVRPWGVPDTPIIREAEFKQLLPHERFTNETSYKDWPKGKLVSHFSFDTELSKEVKIKPTSTWELGQYVAELRSIDNKGDSIISQHYFQVVDTKSKQVPDQKLLVFETEKTSYQVGEVVSLKVGSASADITLVIDIEENHEIKRTLIEHFSANTKVINIPVSESMRPGFAVHCSAVNYNSFLSQSKTFQITKPRPSLNIEVLTFKDKLEPGKNQTWSFSITGSGASQVESEVLASMYDASLDQFKTHTWEFEPIASDHYYGSYNPISTPFSFEQRVFATGNIPAGSSLTSRQFYDRLDWFGLSLTNSTYGQQRYKTRLSYSVTHTGKASRVEMDHIRSQAKGIVTGYITTSDGQPLPGVSILVNETNKGTNSDESGFYSVEAAQGNTLVFSFIGFTKAQAVVGRKNVMNVMMEEDILQLDEIVVIGYGQQKKSNLTGAVSSVSSQEIQQDWEFVTALQGRAAGVLVTGTPGGTSNIRIRGTSSLSASSMPLYVIDGVLVDASTVSLEDISNIVVLRDAAATSLYGSRAVNGAILITTKSGEQKAERELAKVPVRKNLMETAFFFPHLTTNHAGKISFTFTTPEALTRWKFQLLAHTKTLVTGYQSFQAVTQKQLMVTPNAPRFLRVGDELVFSAKITNLTAKNQKGNVLLQLLDATTGKTIDAEFANNLRTQLFETTAKSSIDVSWKIKVPEYVGALQYKIIAKSGSFSDGEQNVLPILPQKILVTETMPIFVRSGQQKTCILGKLKDNRSSSLQHHQLTLEFTSNPVWYAIQALPMLMEFPHECAEQTFSRYYANAIASNVMNRHPNIRAVFDQWSASGALVSNLEKNDELKSLLISETPWLRDAQHESEQKKRLALLFDLATLDQQKKTVLAKLENMQLSGGGFPWFSGSNRPNLNISIHIASGFGHLVKLGILTSGDRPAFILRTVKFLDAEIKDRYNKIIEYSKEIRAEAATPDAGVALAKQYLAENHLTDIIVQYLYMRSFYSDVLMGEDIKPAITYFNDQCTLHWREFSLYSKAMLSMILFRNGNPNIAHEVIASLKETSTTNEEMGMFWKENKSGYYWYESPVEIQSLLIEAFSEIVPPINQEEHRRIIDDMRTWLLKNKQTNAWSTTKSTSEAVYALLMNGNEWLTSDNPIEIFVGGKPVVGNEQKPEAGTGYIKTSWTSEEIMPDMAEVQVIKNSHGIAWGSLHWQYFEDIDKVTSSSSPLALKKNLFKVSRTDRGEVLESLTTDKHLAPGDLVRVRIELKTDRDMEFIHMKDMRAAGLEPVDVLSDYKWQDGLGYYQTTKDAATHFFFDFIAKGVYVFEYDLRVNVRGTFSNGITTIESMYAPEFTSHSEGMRITIH